MTNDWNLKTLTSQFPGPSNQAEIHQVTWHDLATSRICLPRLLSVIPGTCINPLAADQGCTFGGSANKEQGQDLQGGIDSCFPSKLNRANWPKETGSGVSPSVKATSQGNLEILSAVHKDRRSTSKRSFRFQVLLDVAGSSPS